jgi:hypothetical protein
MALPSASWIMHDMACAAPIKGPVARKLKRKKSDVRIPGTVKE